MPDKTSFSSILKLTKISLMLVFLLSACSSANQLNSRPDHQTTGSVSNAIQTMTPLPSKTPPVCYEKKGSIVDRSIVSEILEEDLSFKVYLPPCYSINPDRQYSVLYMLHGQTSLDDQWVRLGLLSTMDDLLAQKKVQPFLIVLPYETKSNLDPFSSKYGEAIIEEVIPYIEEHFQVCTAKTCRTIGGLSRGGNWAVHLGFEHPDMFTAIGAHSAPLFYGEISNIIHFSLYSDSIEELPVFYIDVGDRDPNLEDVQLFNSTLMELNFQREYYEFLGYHDEEYWSAHVQDYLLWYDSQLKAPSSD